MKPSRFNFTTSYPLSDEVIYFNALTGAFFAASAPTAEAIAAVLRAPETNDDRDLKDFLKAQGFLVEQGFDEDAQVLRRNALGISDPNRLDVIVMPNMNCNLACTYCYEEHQTSAMDTDTKRALTAWLEGMVPRFKVVLLSWFGGEPLLSYETLVELQESARGLAEGSGTKLASHVTTNGYLLTPEKGAALLRLGIKSYQITLDGPEAIHDSMRPLVSGGHTFGVIKENICALARQKIAANIKLRINYDSSNIGHVRELLETFPEDVRPRLNVVLERIFGQEYTNFQDSMSLRDAATRVEDAAALAKRLGYAVTMNPTKPERLTYCYADRASQYVFNYNGDIFKCTVDQFKSEDRLGRLSSDGEILWETGRAEEWESVDAFEAKCFECTFMPMCMGGCRKTRLRVGTVGENCKLPFAGFDRRLQQRLADERGEVLPALPPNHGATQSPRALLPVVT